MDVLRYTFILFLLLFSPPVFAQEQDVFQQLQDLKDLYNENVDQVPGVLKSIFGSERMNIYMDDEVIGVVTRDGKIMELKKGEVSDPTMKVTLKEALVKTLLTSPDPGKDFLDAFNRGEITYEAYSATKKITLFVVKMVAKFFSFFY